MRPLEFTLCAATGLCLLASCSRFTGSSGMPRIFTAEQPIDESLHAQLPVRGVLLYEQTKQPAIGIPVKLLERSADRVLSTCLTDERGRFTFGLPRGVASCRIVVTEAGFADLCYEVYNYDRQLSTPILLMLGRRGVLQGCVRTRDGTPIPGARIDFETYFSPRPPTGHGSTLDDINFIGIHSRRRIAVVTDEDGCYCITNLAAPYAYSANLRADGYTAVNDDMSYPVRYRALVRPDRVTILNFTMVERPYVRIQVQDLEQDTVLEYSLRLYALTSEGHVGGYGHADVHAGDGKWYQVDLPRACSGMCFSVRVTTDNGLVQSNGIPYVFGQTNCVRLTLTPGQPCALEGFVREPDGTPYTNTHIQARADRFACDTHTDELGFFRIAGLISGEVVRLSRRFTISNFVAGTGPIEWRMPEFHVLKGRVCIGSPDNPATNFTILNWGGSLRRSVHDPEGRFRVDFETENSLDNRLRACVPGYAPIARHYNLYASNMCDLGTLVIKDPAGELCGRVVDEHHQPIAAAVNARVTGSSDIGAGAVTDEDNGFFSLYDMPPGTCTVQVSLKGARTTTNVLLAPAECTDLGDIVVWTTNSPLVELTFLLPDGTPAAGAEPRSLTGSSADADGRIVTRMRCSTYRYPVVHHRGRRYYAPTITVSPGTRSVELRLVEGVKAAGRALLDGKPLERTYITVRNDRYAEVIHVYKGAFEEWLQPGRYLALCRDKRCTANVLLTERDDNVIAFKSGSAALDLQFPSAGRWSVLLWWHYSEDGRLDMCSFDTPEHTTAKTIDNLPGGNYEVRITGYQDGRRRDLSHIVTLENGKCTQVVF